MSEQSPSYEKLNATPLLFGNLRKSEKREQKTEKCYDSEIGNVNFRQEGSVIGGMTIISDNKTCSLQKQFKMEAEMESDSLDDNCYKANSGGFLLDNEWPTLKNKITSPDEIKRNNEFLSDYNFSDDECILSLKQKVCEMLKINSNESNVTGSFKKVYTTLDVDLQLFIDINTIKTQSSQNDGNWCDCGDDNLITLIFERQDWLKEFLYNFPLSFMSGYYTKEQIQLFLGGLTIVFNSCEDSINIKSQYKVLFERIAKSTKHFFDINFSI